MTEPGLGDLLQMALVVPIRSSTGQAVDPARVPIEGMRHGTDDGGRFLAAYSSAEAYHQYGPPGSDAIELPAREVFARAEAAGERVVIDAGAPAELEVPAAVLPFLAAGIDPSTPEAMRARRPYGELPPLEAPTDVPQPFAGELQRALIELPQVARAWLLRAGTSWTIGIQLVPEAELAAFDEVRNRLHAVANDNLGSRRELAVTDLGAASVREAYESVSGPWYVAAPDKPKGILGRLFGD
ncbi:MAG TPA: SseB family protein [Candidatus Limnocylindria bacterium]|jgi:hypothetical protein